MHTHTHTCTPVLHTPAHPCLRACGRTGPWHDLAHGPAAGHPALPCSHGVARGCSGGTPVPPQGAARKGEGRSGESPRCHLHLQRVPSLRWPRWAGSARDAVLFLEAMRARGRRRPAHFGHLSLLGTVLPARGRPMYPAMPKGNLHRGSRRGALPLALPSPCIPASPCQPQHLRPRRCLAQMCWGEGGGSPGGCGAPGPDAPGTLCDGKPCGGCRAPGLYLSSRDMAREERTFLP